MKADSLPTGASPEITEDRILGGGLLLRQPASGYRTGIYPVFLAAATPLRAQGRALDLGCGVGAAALCLALRQPGLQVTGLEIQPALADLARANVRLNGLDERVAIVTGDLLRPPAGIGDGGFDVVLANPPFHEAGKFSAPKEPGRAQGHMEGEADLAAWIASALNLAAPRGVLAMIHKPERLGDILAGLQGRAGAVGVFPLWAGPGKPARRILLRAEKGSSAPLTLHAGLVLHDADGRYSVAAEAILRQGMPLAF